MIRSESEVRNELLSTLIAAQAVALQFGRYCEETGIRVTNPACEEGRMLSYVEERGQMLDQLQELFEKADLLEKELGLEEGRDDECFRQVRELHTNIRAELERGIMRDEVFGTLLSQKTATYQRQFQQIRYKAGFPA